MLLTAAAGWCHVRQQGEHGMNALESPYLRGSTRAHTVQVLNPNEEQKD